MDDDLPLHLAGNNRPVGDETTALPTRVVGEVPADLRGCFLRNGPNPRTGWSAHLYDGDGMIHAVALDGAGPAGPYRNRYVRTPLHAHPGVPRLALALDPATGRIDHRVTTANTHVVAHGGRLLALEEGGLPVLNAHDDGDRVVLTGTRLPRDPLGTGLPVLHRWTVDPGSGRVAEAPLDDVPSEYPRLADARIGLPHRFGYTTGFELTAEPERSEVHKYDLARGAARTTHRLPRDHTCGEPVFVPRDGGGPGGTAPRSEDDGYLLTFAHDRVEGTSYLLVLDAADVAAPPVAEVHLPVRVPAGFHGTWLPAGRRP